MNLYLIAGGIWIILDGALSIYRYRNSQGQGWKDNAVRVVRMIVGALIVVGGLML
jgi:hypothetical protein